MTSAEDVVRVLDLLDAAGIDVWVDGGWGIDALLGEQTRPHNDLDIAVRVEDRARYDEVIRTAGFRPLRDDGPHNYVAIDDGGCEVDVHFVDFSVTRIDERGIEVYGAIEYDVGALDGTGSILGRPVRCCTAPFQMVSHTRYEPDADDYRDVLALHERFGLPLLPPFDDPERFTPR